MSDQLQRLRVINAGWIADDQAEISRLQDRVAVYRNVIAVIDDMIAEGTPELETAAENVRRERRDIRAAIVECLSAYGSLSAISLKSYLNNRIGELTDSALARSLSSLVGDGTIIEDGEVFSLPPPVRAVSDAAK